MKPTGRLFHATIFITTKVHTVEPISKQYLCLHLHFAFSVLAQSLELFGKSFSRFLVLMWFCCCCLFAMFLCCYYLCVWYKTHRKKRPTKLSKMLAERLLTQTPLRHDKALSCSFNLYHFPAKLSHGIFVRFMFRVVLRSFIFFWLPFSFSFWLDWNVPCMYNQME